ncbi:MAG TPA: polysaccharide biosynthesis/export family protein [Sphingomicrobium sp.]|nr:polysaccharide biosynthesis/export family protein [Sphingomicrobium sp.]
MGFVKMHCATSLRLPGRLAPCLVLLMLGACSSFGASGPSTASVHRAANESLGTANIQVVRVTDAVARQVAATSHSALFSESLGDAPPARTVIGRGDVLQVLIWEAPPAVLFGSSASFGGASVAAALAGGGSVSQQTSIPDMMVDDAGNIRIPFAGSIPAAGRTPRQLEAEIVSRLAGKAHEPQVVVQITRNANADVTVVGDVANNMRVPLTPRGERLLDVLAAAGGVKTPLDKTMIQITRGQQVARMPLAAVVRNPEENVRLQSEDVVTAISESYSFTALGETGKSAEVPFESTGITLAQALGRAGGLNSDRADVRGVFVFRLESPAAVSAATASTARRTADGRIPVIYVVNLKDPASFFIAQTFPIRDKDVLYVSRAPLSDLQRFVTIAASMVFPIVNLSQTPLP